MSPEAVLTELRRVGISLRVDGASLELDGPDEVLTDEVVETVAAHKPALLALLVSQSEAGRPDAPCRSCGTQTWWERPAHHGGGWVCGKCHPDPEILYAEWLTQQGSA